MIAQAREGTEPARVRLVAVVVHPMFVLDDGQALTELSVEPTRISAADWPKVVDLLEEGRRKLEDQLNGV